VGLVPSGLHPYHTDLSACLHSYEANYPVSEINSITLVLNISKEHLSFHPQVSYQGSEVLTLEVLSAHTIDLYHILKNHGIDLFHGRSRHCVA
jgi:hypothetical protein